MAQQSFRTAFYGFNREDVVRYIEYLNNQHNAQLEQLRNQLQNATPKPTATQSELQAELAAALEKCAQLEAQLASAPEQELEAYRRAERAERVAQERAQQIYTQANAILADAAVKAEAESARLAKLAEQADAQLKVYQEAIADTQALFRDATAALYGLKPETEN